MFIQTEATPNPSTLKFLPGRTVMAEGTADFRDLSAAESSPLAHRLLVIKGVKAVFFGQDFITITKDETEWDHLKPFVLGAILEHFLSNDPVVLSSASATAEDEEFFEEKDAQTVATIKELLETRIRPAVASDGGDISFKGFRDGIVYLTMRGACAGCPSSTATLKHGIQNLLRHFLPDVQEVQAIGG
jgi:Fe-S cluster biogenesis protein NfuA